jgi:hypothetical protein
MTQDEDNRSSTRTKLPKRSTGGPGREVAARPVGRPVLEAEDGYSIRLGDYCGAELERLLELTMANRQRVALRKQQERIERRIDRLLGTDDPQDDE